MFPAVTAILSKRHLLKVLPARHAGFLCRHCNAHQIPGLVSKPKAGFRLRPKPAMILPVFGHLAGIIVDIEASSISKVATSECNQEDDRRRNPVIRRRRLWLAAYA
jgi:hypothetical protein